MKLFTSCLCIIVVLFFGYGCKIQSSSDNKFESFNPNNYYKIVLHPEAGSKYHYEIENDSHIKFEVDDKTANNINKSYAGVGYEINKDSAGNYLFHMQYDSIHIYSKEKDAESDVDAVNASVSFDPLEKMLGTLKAANIVAVVTPKGDVAKITGYNEMTDQIMAGFGTEDNYNKDIARKRWNQLIDQGIVKKNMDQLFKIFPDSAMRIGDQWKLDSRQENGIAMNVKTIFTLKSMNSNFTILSAEGEMKSDFGAVNLSGYDVLANLKGKQESEYQIETKTGMLIASKVKAHMEGTIELMGKEIPIEIETSMTMNGRKIN